MTWALFVDDLDRTLDTDADRIAVVSRAYAQSGILTAVIRDDDRNLPVAVDQETILVGAKAQGGSTTLAAAAAAAATNLKLTSVANLAIGDEIVVGDHPDAELRTISTVGTAGAGGTGVDISVPLVNSKASGEQVYEAERLFAGTIRRRVRSQDAGARMHTITARDYTDLLARDLIDVASRTVTESDAARITWLINTHGTKGVTAGAEVEVLVASLPLGDDGLARQDFGGKTVEQAIVQIEAITGGRHYVDFHKRLHSFDPDSVASAAPFGLSDSPNGTTTRGYHDFSLPEDSASKINAVYVIGAVVDGATVKGWWPDPPPAAVDRVGAVLRDNAITTQAQLEEAGAAFLARHDANVEDGRLRTYHAGLLAGMQVQVTNDAWGLAAVTYYVAEVVTSIERGTPLFTVSFGDQPPALSSIVGGIGSTATAALALAEEAMGEIVPVADLSVAGANLVANSGMELAAVGAWTVGSGWTFGYDPIGPQEAFTGSKVARAAPAAATVAGLLTPKVAVDRLDDYWLSAWSFLRAYTSGAARIVAYEYNAADGLVATTVVASLAAAETAWTRHSIHFGPNDALGRTPFHADTAKVQLGFDSAGASATLTWDVDGVQIERGLLMTAYAPAPQELLDGSVSATQIADDAVTTPKLVANAVVAGKIAASAVTADAIAASAVTATKIAAGAVSAAKITAGGLGGRNLVANSGFEHGGFGVMAGWSKSGTAVAVDGVAETGRATTFPFEGRRCLRFAAAAYNYANPTVGTIFQADRWYTASFWICDKGTAYAPTGSGAGLIFESLNGHVKNGLIYLEDGSQQSSSLPFRLLFNASIDASWRRYSVTWQQLDTFEGNFLITNAYGGGAVASGELFFDGIQVEEGAIASAYTPGPMDVRNLTGEVVIDSTGIAVTNGKITVTNPGATVIIDGTSNMFKVAASGTLNITGPNGTGSVATSTAQVDLSTGFAYRPAFLAFVDGTTAAYPNENLSFYNAGTIMRQKYAVTQRLTGPDRTRVFLTWTAWNVNDTASTHPFRYYVLQEVAF